MQRRIFFNTIIVLLLGVVICGILSARIVKKNLVNGIEERLTIEAGLVRELVGESLLSNSDNIETYINKIKQTTNARITIVDSQGNVIIDTEKGYPDMDNHSKRTEIEAAF